MPQVGTLHQTMLSSRHIMVGLLAATSVAAAGCAPQFESEGVVWVDGTPYRPTSCHVLRGCTGVELFDASGTRLELTLPPARLDAFRDISGTPALKLERGGGRPPVTAEACGSLTLTGEGYHGPGKRAASGRTELACNSGAEIKGKLTFRGCF